MKIEDIIDIPHPMPTLVTVFLKNIQRDEDVSYIPIRKDHVDDLLVNFKPWLLGMPIVSVRDDGEIVVLNGSHRCEMLRTIAKNINGMDYSDGLEIDVVAFYGLDRDQEQAIFEKHHKKWIDKMSDKEDKGDKSDKGDKNNNKNNKDNKSNKSNKNTKD